MTTIEINFLNSHDPNSVLGKEISTGIELQELPHDPEKQNIFIRKQFSNSDSEHWKVEKIDTTHNIENQSIVCNIILSPIKFLPVSISKKHQSNGSKLIRGRILECDFGYFFQDISIGNVPSTTVNNYNGRLPFEMVKRRLVVVVSNKEDPALVVPLSTGNKAKDKRTVVKISSLPTDLVTFNNPICYAKTSAISYVSGYRLFPVRYNNGNNRIYDNKIEKKLSNDDVVSIKKAVFTAVGGDNILKALLEKDQQIINLNEQILAKNNKIGELSKEVDTLMDILDKYTE